MKRRVQGEKRIAMQLEEEIKQRRFRSAYHKTALNILFTGNWLHRIHAQELKPHGLTPEQYNVLRILRGQHPEPATVNLLKERMLEKMSNVSRLVEKLRVRGLVDRHVCPDDRRAVDVVITSKGLALLDTLDDAERAWLSRMDLLTEEECSTLNRLLDKVRG
jgi:DNA-binding MarR family transcriptional regulator